MALRNIHSHDVERRKIQRNLCPSLPVSYAQEKATSHPHVPKTRSRASTRTVVAASSVVKQTILRRTVDSGNLVRCHVSCLKGSPPNFIPLLFAETTAVGVLLGVGHDAGADEDDFHSFRRKNAEVDRDVMTEEKVRKMAKVKAGVHTGIVKAYGTIPSVKPKKVVNF